MAANKTFIVKVKNNPNFCGIGAGGAQFAQGEARIESERLANWFKEHDGYTVTEEGAEKPFDKMTADELKAYAAENNIDISAAKNKAEVLAIIQNQQ
jgi:hypothetical protein